MNHLLLKRSYNSSTCKIKKSANVIRNEFLDYFKQDLGHTFIRSSPVTPINDYTLAFVNAGMNQFKGVFLNHYDPPAMKVTNSQKCIRISGKHNDLDIVGSDTYHHTFFEMLGNWSFGSYFKEEACRYAWNLLTKHYGINKEFLYVTYFAGDEKLELQPDLECKDIWLSIGVSKDKILPFGIQENFWEMGLSGPCGPSTEIHVDHTKQLINRSMQVNKQCTDLTELWNIVFIQYERLTNGTIMPLSKHYVDTGMGFERLVALLQEKKSNYDTDIFQPLFKAIQKYANAPEYKGEFFNQNAELDCAYRILADHSRMITVALADGVVPEASNKLRKTIRKSLDISKQAFKVHGILPELSYIVAENLGNAYPELQTNVEKVRKIIRFEEELYKRVLHSTEVEWKEMVKAHPKLKSVTDSTAPGIIGGYKYFQRIIKDLKKMNVLPGEVAFKLYDEFGLSAQTITELANTESLYFDELALQNELQDLKLRSKVGLQKSSELTLRKSLKTLEQLNVPKTDDSFKHKYIFDGYNYQFPKIESKIVALITNESVTLVNEASIKNGIFVDIIKNNSATDNIHVGLILDKTACYSTEEGQESDTGFIYTGDLTFNINNIQKINGYVIHYGSFAVKDKVELESIKENCVVSIKPESRLGLMQHHTAAHLLNSSIRHIMQAVYLRNCQISSHYLKCQFNSFGEKVSLEQLIEMERTINDVIKADIPVTTRVLNTLELLAEDSLILSPRQIYPFKGIRVIDIDCHNLKSKEVCCGAHVPKTGVLEHFCFLGYFSKGASNVNFEAVVGSRANSAKLAGQDIQRSILSLQSEVEYGKITHEEFKSNRLLIEDEIENRVKPIPYIIKVQSLAKLEDLNSLFTKQRRKV